ncbi:MAG: helix-turn-helix transcriptional regulator [Myxococcaceae bacterium]
MTTENLENSSEMGLRIRMARSLLPLNRTEFCEKHGLNRYTIQAWELGRNKIGLTMLRRFCEAMGKEGVFCTPEWLLHGKGDGPSKIGSRGMEIKAEKSWVKRPKEHANETQEIENEAEFFKETQSKAGHSVVVLQLPDSTMEPLYVRGDYVGGRAVPEELVGQLLGQVCLIEVGEGKFVLRRLLTVGSRYLLVPEDYTEQTAILEKLRNVFEILWHRKTGKLSV